MPSTPAGIIVDPNGQSITVNVTAASGAAVAVYTSKDGSTVRNLPSAHTGDPVEFWMVQPDRYVVSMLVNGVENADGRGGTRTVDLRSGGAIGLQAGSSDGDVDEGADRSVFLTRSDASGTYLAANTDETGKAISLLVTDDTRNAANFEQTSATAAALRFRQSGAGPLAKWRTVDTDRGFIQNDGEIKLLPASNGRAVTVNAPSWAAAKVYGYGQVDYLFGGETWTDASGASAADPGGLTYSKGFGLRAVKTGKGNMDAFWASITHSGVDEVGGFIFDAHGTGGGNLWGEHLALYADTAEANMYGTRIELFNNVAGATKTKVGAWLRSLGTQAGTVGLQVSGTGGWTNYIVLRDTTDASVFTVRGSDGLVSTRAISATGAIIATSTITASSATDGAQILRLQTDRPWAFRQVGTAGSTVLRLSPDATEKVFRITAPTSNRTFETNVSDTVGNSYAWIMPEAGGKVGFFGTAPVLRPTGTPAAATDAATTQTLVNSLRSSLLALGLVAA